MLRANGQAGDYSGFDLDICGTTVLVMTPGHDDPNEHYGAVSVFEPSGRTWLHVVELRPADLPNVPLFVNAIALDFDQLVVTSMSALAAYVFERSEGRWEQTAKLQASDPGPEGFFGFGDSADLDSGRVVVGAPYDSEFVGRAGAVYVFEIDSLGLWTEKAKLVADDAEGADILGSAVGIQGDTIVAGAPSDDDLGFASGSAYVFEQDPNGNWSQTAKLLASDGAVLQIFGTAVCVQGDLVLIGATLASGVSDGTGAVYAFNRQPDGSWVQTQKLFADDGEISQDFGWSVSVDGDVAVIGARRADPRGRESAGAAYVFHRDMDGIWRQVSKLIAPDGRTRDEFGYSVGISGDNVAVGAALDNNPNGVDAGSAYVFAIGPDDNHNGTPDPCDCIGDLDGDGDVDLSDLVVQLANFGVTSGATLPDGDLDFDGDVDLEDLVVLLGNFGGPCP